MVVGVIAAPSPAAEVPLPRNRPPQEEIDKPVAVWRPGSKEIATLVVRGFEYTNWTSVRVEARVAEAFPVFQFECTEETPTPLTIDAAQFRPGDEVRVFLGGLPAIKGYITERHVAYDASNHGVKLIGCGDTVDLVESSVPPDQFGNHDGKSVTQLARDLSKHLGIAIHEHGNVDHTPFKNIQVLPGETPMAAIERYAKMRAIVIGSEPNGGLALIGENPAIPTGELVESVHILRANAVLRDSMIYRKIFAVGQNVGGDSANGDPQNKLIASVDGSSTRNRILVVLADVADTQYGINQRAKMEKFFTEGGKAEMHITVQGWFKDNNTSDEIWRAGEYYTINSPSLLLYGVVLGCASCVYEQGEGGTTTTLQMVDPLYMEGVLNLRPAALKFLDQERAEAEAKARAKAEAARKAKEGT